MDDADKIWIIKTLGRLSVQVGSPAPPDISDISEAVVLFGAWKERFPDEDIRAAIGNQRYFLLTSTMSGLETRQQPGSKLDHKRVERLQSYNRALTHWRKEYALHPLKEALRTMGLDDPAYFDGVRDAATRGALIVVECDGALWTRIAHIRSGMGAAQPRPLLDDL